MITAENLVNREVHYCLSSLVSRLVHLEDEAALDLASPIEDWEEAARELGWGRNEHNGYFTAPLGHDVKMAEYDSWQDLCDAENIEPHQWEVYEFWAVSDWLADRLIAQGEKVDKDFHGATVWARTTTGQGIAMDAVIQKIAAELIAS